jgi:hypothetical protein
MECKKGPQTDCVPSRCGLIVCSGASTLPEEKTIKMTCKKWGVNFFLLVNYSVLKGQIVFSNVPNISFVRGQLSYVKFISARCSDQGRLLVLPT